jgi:hypothetical protein
MLSVHINNFFSVYQPTHVANIRQLRVLFEADYPFRYNSLPFKLASYGDFHLQPAKLCIIMILGGYALSSFTQIIQTSSR